MIVSTFNPSPVPEVWGQKKVEGGYENSHPLMRQLVPLATSPQFWFRLGLYESQLPHMIKDTFFILIS